MKPIQDIPQTKKTANCRNDKGYKGKIRDYGSNEQLVLFANAVVKRTCRNIFKDPPCENKLTGRQKMFCCTTCKNEFRKNIKIIEKQERSNRYEKELNIWINENPTAYEIMKRWCMNDYKLGIERISVKWIIGEARRRMQIKWDNSWTSLLARRLIEDCPDLKDVIEIRQRLLEGWNARNKI